MTKWESTIVTTPNSDRFGTVRRCRNCECQETETVTGRRSDPELSKPCPGDELTQVAIKASTGDKKAAKAVLNYMTAPKVDIETVKQSKAAFIRKFGPMTIDTGYGGDIEEYADTQKQLWKAWEAGRKFQIKQ